MVIETIRTTVEVIVVPVGSREELGVAFVDCRLAEGSWASVVVLVEEIIEHLDHLEVVEYL